MNKISHDDGGLKGILKHSNFYNLFSTIIESSGEREKIFEDLLQANSKSRILDIGCGPGSFLKFLPAKIGSYLGVDNNQDYINYALKKIRYRPEIDFRHGFAEDLNPKDFKKYDIVLGLALLHHLSDLEVKNFIDFVSNVLSPNGKFLTYDPVLHKNQHYIAKWLIKNDRGKHVRTQRGYEVLLDEFLQKESSQIFYRTLKIPYSILVTVYAKKSKKFNTVSSLK